MRNADRCCLLALLTALSACSAYVNSTPRSFLEDDHVANYQRVFGEPPPADVEVVNSVLVAYERRPSVVTTDDFEFELLATRAWIDRLIDRYYLKQWNDDGDHARRQARRIRPWYAPGPVSGYELYRDLSSIGYLHLLVDREPAGERLRVFVSKH